MKKCTSCNNLVKNSYQLCFECNNKQKNEDSGSETPHYKKENIPKTVRNCLWINYFGSSRVGVCACCHREPITMNNFHASHIQAEREHGKTSLDNLAPCCVQCNLSMGTMNMNDFIAKYNLHFGLDKSLNIKI
jgi:5-methylcytosine-specific restriction endonuclease McrA